MAPKLETTAAEWHPHLAQHPPPALGLAAGELYRRNIIVSVAGRSLANQTAPDVLRLHHFAAGHVDPCITVHTTVALLKALKVVVSQPFRVDVGLLLVELKVS